MLSYLLLKIALRYDEYIKSKSLKNNKKAISFADLNMLKTIKSNIENIRKQMNY